MSDFLRRMYDRLWNSASDEMKACLAAGVPIEYEYDRTTGMLTAKTAVPVSVQRDAEGRYLVFQAPSK